MKWLVVCLMCLPGLALASPMLEIQFEDIEPGEAPYLSRVLIAGDKMRLDYGNDAEDFTLYDRKAGKVYVVSHEARRITEVKAGKATLSQPADWQVDVQQEAAGAEQRVKVSLNGKVCLEARAVKTLLPDASRMLRDLRRALAGHQSASWQATPKELREPCFLLLDVLKAGIEYDYGMPLSLNYGDGRSRTYRSHAVREAPASLLKLPAGYQPFKLEVSP